MLSLLANPGVYVESTDLPYLGLICWIAAPITTAVLIAIDVGRLPFALLSLITVCFAVVVSAGAVLVTSIPQESQGMVDYRNDVSAWMATEYGVQIDPDMIRVRMDETVKQIVATRDGEPLIVSIAVSDGKVVAYDGNAKQLVKIGQ
jgi:hypothetical protein